MEHSSEYFITAVEQKTEEQLQTLFQGNFVNDDVQKIKLLRSQRDEGLRRAFKKFKKSLNLEDLVKKIKKCLEKSENFGI